MTRAWIAGVLLALVAGCYAAQGESYRAADFPRMRTLAVLPVVNQTQVPMASATLVESMVKVLEREKKYAVVPPAVVGRELSSGQGAAAYVDMINRRSRQQPVPDELFERMARALEADGVLTATVTGYHSVPEQGPATNAQGMVYYTTYDVTVVEVEGELYSRQARTVVWRDRHLERQFLNPQRGRRPVGFIADAAVRGLLDKFPVNTWAPYAPPTPTPSPTADPQ